MLPSTLPQGFHITGGGAGIGPPGHILNEVLIKSSWKARSGQSLTAATDGAVPRLGTRAMALTIGKVNKVIFRNRISIFFIVFNCSILSGSFGFAANFNNFNTAFINLFKLPLLHCNGLMDRSCIACNGFLEPRLSEHWVIWLPVFASKHFGSCGSACRFRRFFGPSDFSLAKAELATAARGF